MNCGKPPPAILRTGPKLRTTPKIRNPWEFPRRVPKIRTTVVSHKQFWPKLGNNTIVRIIFLLTEIGSDGSLALCSPDTQTPA